MAVSNQTTGPIIMTAQGDSITSSVYISWVRWIGGTTDGHVMEITDHSGNRICKSQADGASFLDIIPIFRMRKGIIVNSLGSGTLEIHYR